MRIVKEDVYMEDNIKLYSDMERYEIININDGDKYSNLGSNDLVIDENGILKFLIINEGVLNLVFFVIMILLKFLGNMLKKWLEL